MDAETTRLEIWTEFVDAPDSTVNTVFLKPETDPQNPKGGVDPYLSDDEVNFGEASLAGGSAFSLEDELADPFQAPILVGKTWTTIAGRRFLIEKVDYMDVAAQLARLPKSAAIQSLPKGRKEAHPAKLRETLLASLAKPGRKPSNSAAGTLTTASVSVPAKGLILDYLIVSSSATNYTFKSDSTYFISAHTTLSGTTVI